MLVTLVRRVTVRTLDVVVDRGKASERAPIRFAAKAIERARAWVHLHEVPRAEPLPQWSGEHPPRPMWESDRKKMEKWQVDQGIKKPAEEAPKPQPVPTKAKNKRLPVVNANLHPEHSPFEDLALDDRDAATGVLDHDALVALVKVVLDECRPLVQSDGGDIELLDVQDDVVHVQLTGNCVGCPSSQASLRQGIERRLKARIPQIQRLASPQLAG
jgi:Fe-S cluster biogenesis protein NfuA